LRIGTNSVERMRIDSTGLINVTGGIQVTENVTPSAGSGIEIFKPTSTSGQIQAFNRSGNAWMDLILKGNTQQFHANGTERMRINSSGSLLVGTSTTSSFPDRLISAGDHTRSSSYIDIRSTTVGALLFADGTSGDAAYRGQVEYHHPTDSMRFWTAADEAMRINSSGSITINAVPGTNNNANQAVLFQTSAGVIDGGSGLLYNPAEDVLKVNGGKVSSTTFSGTGNSGILTCQNGAGQYQFQATNAALIFTAGSSERMRINSAGTVLFGLTSDTTTANIGVSIEDATGRINSFTQSGVKPIRFYKRYGSENGSISMGNSSVAYNTSSDYRLKENVVTIADGITRVKQLQPRRFNFIADDTTTVDGFLAHEAQAVVPEAVTGEKDGEEMQGIDQSKLVPLLTAALQEAIAKIETLETKVASLEASS